MNEAVVQVPSSILRALVGLSVVGILAAGYNLGQRAEARASKKQ